METNQLPLNTVPLPGSGNVLWLTDIPNSNKEQNNRGIVLLHVHGKKEKDLLFTKYVSY